LPAGGADGPLNLDVDIRIRRKGPITKGQLATVFAGLAWIVYWILRQ
jgi:hypothetical protein